MFSFPETAGEFRGDTGLGWISGSTGVLLGVWAEKLN